MGKAQRLAWNALGSIDEWIFKPTISAGAGIERLTFAPYAGFCLPGQPERVPATDAASSRFLFHGGMRGFKLPQHLLPVQGFVWMAVPSSIPDVIADDSIDLHCTTQLVN